MRSYNPIYWENLPSAIIESIDAAKAEYGYNNVGIRIQDGVKFEVGPIDNISHVWIDGEETEEELDGICAISAADISNLCRNAGCYFGDHAAIIVGEIIGYGEDHGEVIFSGAEVWEVLA